MRLPTHHHCSQNTHTHAPQSLFYLLPSQCSNPAAMSVVDGYYEVQNCLYAQCSAQTPPCSTLNTSLMAWMASSTATMDSP